jgi:hypothetical protein
VIEPGINGVKKRNVCNDCFNYGRREKYYADRTSKETRKIRAEKPPQSTPSEVPKVEWTTVDLGSTLKSNNLWSFSGLTASDDARAAIYNLGGRFTSCGGNYAKCKH